MKSAPIKRASTLFLKVVIILFGAVAVAICVFSFPAMWSVREVSAFTYVFYPAITGFYGSAIPFFIALYQALKLLHYIDENNAFSELSVNALKIIKYCAVAMSVLYAAGLPLVAVFSELDDAPGGILIGMAIVCAPLIIATFAAILQKLVQSAVDMKLENDLTV